MPQDDKLHQAAIKVLGKEEAERRRKKYLFERYEGEETQPKKKGKTKTKEPSTSSDQPNQEASSTESLQDSGSGLQGPESPLIEQTGVQKSSDVFSPEGVMDGFRQQNPEQAEYIDYLESLKIPEDKFKDRFGIYLDDKGKVRREFGGTEFEATEEGFIGSFTQGIDQTQQSFRDEELFDSILLPKETKKNLLEANFQNDIRTGKFFKAFQEAQQEKEGSFTGNLLGGQLMPMAGAIAGGTNPVGAMQTILRYGDLGSGSNIRQSYYEARMMGEPEEEAFEIAQNMGDAGRLSGMVEGGLGVITGNLGNKLPIKSALGKVAANVFLDTSLDAGAAAGLQVAENQYAQSLGLDRDASEGVLENVMGEVLLSSVMGTMKASPVAANVYINRLKRAKTQKDVQDVVESLPDETKKDIQEKLSRVVTHADKVDKAEKTGAYFAKKDKVSDSEVAGLIEQDNQIQDDEEVAVKLTGINNKVESLKQEKAEVYANADSKEAVDQATQRDAEINKEISQLIKDKNTIRKNEQIRKASLDEGLDKPSGTIESEQPSGAEPVDTNKETSTNQRDRQDDTGKPSDSGDSDSDTNEAELDYDGVDDVEYEAFIQDGVVSDNTILGITDKIKRNKQLDDRERKIAEEYAGDIQAEIQKQIEEQKTKTNEEITNEAETESMLEGVRDGRNEEEGGQEGSELRSQEEELTEPLRDVESTAKPSTASNTKEEEQKESSGEDWVISDEDYESFKKGEPISNEGLDKLIDKVKRSKEPLTQQEEEVVEAYESSIAQSIQKDVSDDLIEDDGLPNTPEEIAEAYLKEQQELNSVSIKEKTIADNIQSGIKPNSYYEFGDRNKVNKGIAKTYLKNSGYTVDQIAQMASDQLGAEVTTDDIIDFTERYNFGVEKMGQPSGNVLLSKLRDKYKSATGKTLNANVAKAVAKKLKTQQGKQEIEEALAQYVDENNNVDFDKLGEDLQALQFLYNLSDEQAETVKRYYRENQGANRSDSDSPDGTKSKGEKGNFESVVTKNVNKAIDHLDKVDKDLSKFGKENLSSGLPVVVAQASVKSAKAALKAGKAFSEAVDAAIDAARKSDWYKSLADADKKDAENKVRDFFINQQVEEAVGVSEAKEERKQEAKARKKVRELTGEQKQKKITLNERSALKDQIKKEVKAANEGYKQARREVKEFAKKIKEVVEDAKKKGVLTPNQAASLANAAAKVSTPRQLEKFDAYARRVFAKADYLNNLSQAKKGVKTAKGRLKNNDFGIKGSNEINRALKVNPRDLTIPQLDRYNQFLADINKGSFKRETHEENINYFMDMADDQQSESQQSIKEPNPEAEAKAMERKAMFQQELKDARKRELKNLPEEYERQYEDVQSLTDSEIEAMTPRQREEIINGLDNLENGRSMTTKGLKAIQDAFSERIKNKALETTNDRKFKTLLRDIINPLKFSWKKVRGKTMAEKYTNYMRELPLNRLDSMLKGPKGTQLYKALIQPIAVGHSEFTQARNEMRRGFNKAYSKVGSGIINPVKRTKYRNDEMIKLQLISIDKEYKNNPGNPEVNPLDSYIQEMEYAAYMYDSDGNVILDDKGNPKVKREGYAELAKNYKKVYEGMLEDGGFDYTVQEVKLDPATKKLQEFVEKFWQDNLNKAEVAAMRSGKNVTLRNFYTPIKVNVFDATNLSEIADASNSFMEGNPSMKSANLTKRTEKAKPIYMEFDINFLDAATGTLQDYYMQNPLMTTSRALNKIKASNIDADQMAFYEAVSNELKQKTRNEFVNNYYDPTGLKKFVQTARKRGYQSTLGSAVRSGVELGSNLSHASLTEPRALTKGLKSGIDGTQARKIAEIAGSTQISRLFGRGDSIMIEQGGMAGSSTSRYGKVVDWVNNKVVGIGDIAVARPVWTGKFLNEFKKATGEALDVDKMINDQNYRRKHKQAIETARDKADDSLSRGFASTNPYEGITASQVTMDDNLLEMSNKYMTRFVKFEFQSMLDGIEGLVGKNHLTRAEGASLIAGTIIRMAAYQAMLGASRDMFYSMVEGLLGMDTGEDRERDMIEEFYRGGLGAVVSLFAFRRLGNFAKIPLSMSIEMLNREFGQEIGLRDDDEKYNGYENSIVFNQLSVEKGEFNDLRDVVPNFTGPFAPLIKASIGAGNAIQKTGIPLNNPVTGENIMEPKARSNGEYVRKMNELKTRWLPELFMTTAGLPLSKDVKSILIRETYKDYRK